MSDDRITPAIVDIADVYAADPNVVKIQAAELTDTDRVFDVWGDTHPLVPGSVKRLTSGAVRFKRTDQPDFPGEFEPGEITVYREARQ